MKQQLKFIFLFMIISGTIFIIHNLYITWEFNNFPLDKSMRLAIDQKRDELISRTLSSYDIYLPVPVKIENLPDNLYGVTIYNRGDIYIILNRKMFRESFEYILSTVLPHEFAHAVILAKSDFTDNENSHSNEWQNICIELQGKNCEQFVNIDDVISDKIF